MDDKVTFLGIKKVGHLVFSIPLLILSGRTRTTRLAIIRQIPPARIIGASLAARAIKNATKATYRFPPRKKNDGDLRGALE